MHPAGAKNRAADAIVRRQGDIMTIKRMDNVGIKAWGSKLE